MELSTGGDGAVLRLEPAELHVVHLALHQYGEHLLPQAIRDAPSEAASLALAPLRDRATDLGHELDEACRRLGHRSP